MKIFSIVNKSNNGALIVAKDEDRAKELFYLFKYVRNINNSKCKDITLEYINNHSNRGFDLSKLNEGQLVQDIGRTSSWSTNLP